MKSFLRQKYEIFSINYPQTAFLIRKIIKYIRLFYKVKKKIKGSGNTINAHNVIMLGVTFDIQGSGNKIDIAKNAILIKTTFLIRGNNHQITIQENCIFSSGGTIWMEHENGKLLIGKNTTMEEVHIAVTENNSSVIIGEDCMLAYDIDIRSGDSHSILDTNSKKRINKAKNITIGNHVWLAAHSRILKGVQIADNCVIGSDTVVTKSIVQPNVIVAGNPAKVVKEDILWKRENIQ
jgi:acetyltransferase-like isoleucine patch superfamily enzyme